MKLKIIGIIGLLCVVSLTAMTCKTQRAAYNTIAGVEATASASFDGYLSAVIAGKIPTNSVPDVSLKFDQLQSAATLAAAADQAGTNALAPTALSAELTDLLTLVQTLNPPK